MTVRDENAHRSLDNHFTGRISRVAEAARIFAAERALQQATWEPHDWSDFS